MRMEARDVRVSLKGREVLRGLDAAAQPGQLTAIIGPNGAGKTTLLKVFAGLIAPQSGSVAAAGRSIPEWNARELARARAYLPQDRTVHWALTVRAIVALGRLPHQPLGAGESSADAAAVEAALSDMELKTLAQRPVLELSGGERARVLMARALAQQPRVLLADEPAAGLDPAHQLALFHHLATLAEAGCTVMVALHDLSLAARFCHSVILVHGGRTIAAGAPRDVLTAQHLAAAYGITAQYQVLNGVPVVLATGVLP
jgi:iron complex transport system ATP-binding protein